MSVGFVRYRHIEAVERDGNKAALYQVGQFRAAWQGARFLSDWSWIYAFSAGTAKALTKIAVDT